MNRQAKELTKAMLSTIASLLLSVKNTVIEYQAKLFPFAKAFLGLCLSGLLLVSCASGLQGRKGLAMYGGEIIHKFQERIAQSMVKI